MENESTSVRNFSPSFTYTSMKMFSSGFSYIRRDISILNGFRSYLENLQSSQDFTKFLILVIIPETHGVAIHYASSSNSNGIIERFHNTLLEMYMANRKKVDELTLYQGLSLITAIYNDSKHSATLLTPRQIIFGNATSLDLHDINLTKQRIIMTARDNIAQEVRRHNTKQVIGSKEYENIRTQEVLVKTKAKPSPYRDRYRKIEIQEQNEKTITDTMNIKIHKKTCQKTTVIMRAHSLSLISDYVS